MSTQQDTDDDRSITLEQQAKLAVGDDTDDEVVAVPDEPVATTVDDFGVEVDPHDPETCIDEPKASGLTADDRPEDDDTIGASEQKPLVADVQEGQTDLEGDEVHGQPMFETDDSDDSESDDATDTDAEHPDTGEDTDESTEADEQSDDAADECDETADDEATETTDEETEVDLLDSGIIDEAGVPHRELRAAVADTEYDLRLTSIPGIGEETAEQLRGVKCPDTALLAVGWASDHYHAHVVDALSELPVNHRERAIADIEALYDDVLAEVVEPEAAWVDDATPGPDANADTDSDVDADDPLPA